MASLDHYAQKFKFLNISRTDGILTLELHSKGESMRWSRRTHDELGEAFVDIASDPENKVVVMTGVGTHFISERFRPTDPDLLAKAVSMDGEKWDRVFTHGIRLLQALIDIPVPMIAAVNGPALVHPELAALCDIVVAAQSAAFMDGHFQWDIVPGDGSHIVWPMLLGPNRGRQFLLSGRVMGVDEALGVGVVSEIVASKDLKTRAFEIAQDIARKSERTRRYTRMLFAQPFRRAFTEDLALGLSLEGLARWRGPA